MCYVPGSLLRPDYLFYSYKEFLQSPIVCICSNVTNFDVHNLMDLGPVESYVVGAEVSSATFEHY